MMETIRTGYQFQLKPTPTQLALIRNFADSCRFVWNRALTWEKLSWKRYREGFGYGYLSKMLTVWKKETKTAFLGKVYSQILQQQLMDLERAFKNFYAGAADFPRFKVRTCHDYSFRYPQGGLVVNPGQQSSDSGSAANAFKPNSGFKIDEQRQKIYLPKIGWVKYRASRKIQGIPKQVTVILNHGRWHISVQTESLVEIPEPINDSTLGIDVGVDNFAFFSDGTYVEPLGALKKKLKRLEFLQESLSRKVSGSCNWFKAVKKVNQCRAEMARIRRDFLHKLSTRISRAHANVAMEDLRLAGGDKSPSPLDYGWGEFGRQLKYKLHRSGGRLVWVSPDGCGQKCSHCGFVDSKNRPLAALFRCPACGFEINADLNAAMNVRAAGLAVLACGGATRSMEPLRESA